MDRYRSSLSTSPSRLIVQIGGVDVTPAVKSFTATAKLNDLATAEITLDASSSLLRSIDLYAEVRILRGEDRPVFTGDVASSQVASSDILLRCRTGTEFTNRRAGGVQTLNSNIDLVYALVRDAGLPEDRIDIRGFSFRNRETFEVSLPLENIDRVATTLRFGRVAFVNKERVLNGFRHLSRSEITELFSARELFATTYVTASTLYDAERAAISVVDPALAWLTARSRFSSAVSPNLEPLAWDRDWSLARISRLPMALVRGLGSGRAWVRDIEATPRETTIDFEHFRTDAILRLYKGNEPAALKQALVAYSRAASANDQIGRVVGIWDALEFYVGSTQVPDLFSKKDRKTIRFALKGVFSGSEDQGKRKRLDEVLGRINNPPLGVRLRHRLALDSVPISNDEMDFLWQLRSYRNDASHGREVASIDSARIDRGLALVSRVLAYALRAQQHKT